MKRRKDWEQRLSAYFAAVHEKPHKYGHHDCLLHPANAVKAITGHDYGRGHRGKYKDPASAVLYLRSIGFDNPEAMLASLLEEKPVGFAQRGDLVLVPGNETLGWAIPGVCDGAVALVVADNGEREGLFRIPREQWLKAWKIG